MLRNDLIVHRVAGSYSTMMFDSLGIGSLVNFSISGIRGTARHITIVQERR